MGMMPPTPTPPRIAGDNLLNLSGLEKKFSRNTWTCHLKPPQRAWVFLFVLVLRERKKKYFKWIKLLMRRQISRKWISAPVRSPVSWWTYEGSKLQPSCWGHGSWHWASSPEGLRGAPGTARSWGFTPSLSLFSSEDEWLRLRNHGSLCMVTPEFVCIPGFSYNHKPLFISTNPSVFYT